MESRMEMQQLYVAFRRYSEFWLCDNTDVQNDST